MYSASWTETGTKNVLLLCFACIRCYSLLPDFLLLFSDSGGMKLGAVHLCDMQREGYAERIICTLQFEEASNVEGLVLQL